jgi:predicted lipoprotein with Yx(FWY)xxD motif
MKRYLIAGFVAASALALAACGSGGGSSSSGAAKTGSGAALSVRQVNGVGKVLVDSSGHALYTPAEEANGMVLCTGGCTAFWKPVSAGATLPATPAGAGTLGVVTRPDGTKQLTEDGKPLYTFVEDTSTTVKGNDFTDDFGGTHFTWHAVVTQGSASAPAGGQSTTTTSPSSGSGYGY